MARKAFRLLQMKNVMRGEPSRASLRGLSMQKRCLYVYRLQDGLSGGPANVETTDQISPLVHHAQHAIESLSGPTRIETASLRQLHHMAALDVQTLTTNIHLVLTTWTLAVSQVKTRRQLPLALRVHAESQIFGVVIPVVKQHIEDSALKRFLHLALIARDHARGP